MSPLTGRAQRRFRQLEIPISQLQAGVYSPKNELVPWGAIATLHPGARDLQERLGIGFSDSYDQLDFVKVALLELPSTRRVALVEHVNAPIAGTEVHAEVDGAPAAQDLLAEVREALELAEGEVAWQRYQ